MRTAGTRVSALRCCRARSRTRCPSPAAAPAAPAPCYARKPLLCWLTSDARRAAGLLDEPIIDGHNRALLAYIGTHGWGGGGGEEFKYKEKRGGALWPDEECDLGSMAPDSSGKIRGQYPSEMGKADPFTDYRLPCTREAHYNDGASDDNGGYRGGDRKLGALHFSDPVLMGKYNFSAVLHWWNHDCECSNSGLGL